MYTRVTLTNLDIAYAIEKDIVTLNVAMNDILAVKMGQPLAGLYTGRSATLFPLSENDGTKNLPRSKS
jgi:hypothetical protein